MTSTSPTIGPGQLLLLKLSADEVSKYRILGVNPGDQSVWLFDCQTEKRGLPIELGYEQTMRRIREGDAEIAKLDPYIVYPGTNSRLSNEQKAIWEKSWIAIAPLVASDHHELLLQKGSRGERLRKRAAELPGMDVKRLLTLVRRYWIGGMRKEAVQPHYSQCGIGLAQMNIRRGRRRGDMKATNLPLFEPKLYAQAVTMCLDLIGGGMRPYTAATQARVENYGIAVVIMGKSQLRIPDDPSLRINIPQAATIMAAATKKEDRPSQKARAASDKQYNQENRPIRGTASNAAFGPGQIYEIDATPLGMTLRSRLNGETALTQPTLYSVVDAYSSVIVGFYVTLQSENGLGARLAIHNAFGDKGTYLESLGITAEDLQEAGIPCVAECFPPRHGCVRIKHDRGSGFKSIELHEALSMIDVGSLVLAPVRPDRKGAVENSILRLVSFLKTMIADKEVFGMTSPSHDEDGIYDLFQLERVIAIQVMKANLLTAFKAYPKSFRNQKGTDPCPMDVHMQGLQTFKRPPILDDQEIDLSFLPRGTLRWSRSAWRLEGYNLFYVFGPEARFSMLRGVGASRTEIECVYHPAHMGRIQTLVEGQLNDCAYLKGEHPDDPGVSLGEYLMQEDARRENSYADRERKDVLASGFTAMHRALKDQAIDSAGGIRAQVAKGVSSEIKKVERKLLSNGPQILSGTTVQVVTQDSHAAQACLVPTSPAAKPPVSNFAINVNNTFKKRDW